MKKKNKYKEISTLELLVATLYFCWKVTNYRIFIYIAH